MNFGSISSQPVLLPKYAANTFQSPTLTGCGWLPLCPLEPHRTLPLQLAKVVRLQEPSTLGSASPLERKSLLLKATHFNPHIALGKVPTTSIFLQGVIFGNLWHEHLPMS